MVHKTIDQSIMTTPNTICPLPWIQLSVHLDTSMRFCCNTDNGAYIFHKGKQVTFRDLEEMEILNYFNSDTLRMLRKMMISGEVPSLCHKCFIIEKNNGVSTRQIFLRLYSKNKSFLQLLSDTNSDGTLKQFNIQRLDFSMSNQCSLRCLMCNPCASNALTEEFNTLGLDYSESFATSASHKWNDLFVDKSFILRIANDAQNIFITGGEPLTNRTHQRLLEQLINLNLSSKIALEYNTNGNHIDPIFFKLWKKFRHIYFHFSIDGKDSLNEYIRFGSRWDKIKKNLSRILNIKNSSTEVHTCVMNINAAELPSLYLELLKLPPMIAKLPHHIYVDSPSHLSIQNLPNALKSKVRTNIMNFLNHYSDKLLVAPHKNWNTRAIRNILSLLDIMDHKEKSPQEWKKFVHTTLLHDRHRGNNILDVLPYFGDYIEDCNDD